MDVCLMQITDELDAGDYQLTLEFEDGDDVVVDFTIKEAEAEKGTDTNKGSSGNSSTTTTSTACTTTCSTTATSTVTTICTTIYTTTNSK